MLMCSSDFCLPSAKVRSAASAWLSNNTVLVRISYSGGTAVAEDSICHISIDLKPSVCRTAVSELFLHGCGVAELICFMSRLAWQMRRLQQPFCLGRLPGMHCTGFCTPVNPSCQCFFAPACSRRVCQQSRKPRALQIPVTDALKSCAWHIR